MVVGIIWLALHNQGFSASALVFMVCCWSILQLVLNGRHALTAPLRSDFADVGNGVAVRVGCVMMTVMLMPMLWLFTSLALLYHSHLHSEFSDVDEVWISI
jgi:hypothetical protein